MVLNIESNLLLVLSFIAVSIAVICWVWSICLILQILKSRSVETKLINSLITDIEKIKQNISNNFKQ